MLKSEFVVDYTNAGEKRQNMRPSTGVNDEIGEIYAKHNRCAYPNLVFIPNVRNKRKHAESGSTLGLWQRKKRTLHVQQHRRCNKNTSGVGHLLQKIIEKIRESKQTQGVSRRRRVDDDPIVILPAHGFSTYRYRQAHTVRTKKEKEKGLTVNDRSKDSVAEVKQLRCTSHKHHVRSWLNVQDTQNNSAQPESKTSFISR